MRPADLAKSLRETLVALRASHFRNAKVDLRVVLPPSYWCECDVRSVLRVAMNIVSNAAKFTLRGYVAVQMRPEPDGFTLIVEDTGRGMTPSQLRTAREIWSRSPTTEGGGSGIGLFVCDRIVRTYHGRLDIDSTVGQGTVVSLWLPLPRISPPPTVASSTQSVHSNGTGGSSGACEVTDRNDSDYSESLLCAAPTPTPSADAEAKSPEAALEHVALTVHEPTVRILLAEDVAVNRKLAVRQLRRLGHSVASVENGQEALEALCVPDCPFDIVLMDINMPVMDGYEATRAYRTWAASHRTCHPNSSHPKHLPIIAVTGNTTIEDMNECKVAGCDAFIPKPFRVEDIDAVISKHCKFYSGSSVAR